jgi:hypothetical protein
MLFLFWFLLVLAGSCVFLVVPTFLGWTIYDRYRGTRMVTCPQTQAPALVRLDAFHAACTGMFTTEKLRLASCTLWPQHIGCAQGCIPEAVAFESPLLHEEVLNPTRGIHTLSVGGAIAAYWLINAIWYSHYLFRSQWMQLMGFSEEQVRRMILQSVPQLATLLWSVCFTLALAWFIASNHRYGFWRGLEAGCIAWSPVLLGLVVAIVYRGLPADLIWIYGSSSLVSSMVAGAILGTWTKGRILHVLGEDQ